MVTVPRLALGAIASSQGKTTATIGLLGALYARGLVVAPFKIGPDYIDPGFHTMAAHRVGRNLDPHLCGEDRIAPLLAHGAAGADIAILEGAMGLFDGRIGTDAIGGGAFGSSAHVVALTQTPVLLVLDASKSSRTVAAVAAGMAHHDPAVKVAGVLLNRCGSARNIAEIRRILEADGLPVVGTLPKSSTVQAPSRHLGLIPAAELAKSSSVLAAATQLVTDNCDLDAILALAQSAPELTSEPWNPAAEVTPVSGRPRIAVATGRAFTFRYAETDDLLRAAGCEPVPIDPICDLQLPSDIDGLLIGGGFPEEHAAALSANISLRTDISRAVKSGLPTIAECAGLLYLCRTLDGAEMAGAIDADAVMTKTLTLRYHDISCEHDSLAGEAGTTLTAHEFHRTVTTFDDGYLTAFNRGDNTGEGICVDPANTGTSTLLATYQHIHWAGHPQICQRFAAAAASHKAQRSAQQLQPWEAARNQILPPPASVPADEPDLRHHGDQDAVPGLIDLAVNVRDATPPAWLQETLISGASQWARYPDVTKAREAIAARHKVPVDMVLPTAGGAEAFTLIAQAFGPATATIVHPQFTEPEQALRSAGWKINRLLLTAAESFSLAPVLPQIQSDNSALVAIGNPTNPTGALHSRRAIGSLATPDRIVLVDEAFMDAVPDETESMISNNMAGILVIRSLTKTWSLAGIRAGYVVGDPKLIAKLAAIQPPWSVSTPAADAMIACSSDTATAAANSWAQSLIAPRKQLVTKLREAGFPVVGTPATPFLLVDCATLGDLPIRESLAKLGFAVRRGESFPGLGTSWIRIAQRDEATMSAFVAALVQLKEQQ
ncbi:MAG: cobyrinate a,c-diamide synthase [Propionibacteriaceae bacterium]